MDLLRAFLPTPLATLYDAFAYGNPAADSTLLQNPILATLYRVFLVGQSIFYQFIFPTLYPLYTILTNTIRSLLSSETTSSLSIPQLLLLVLTLYVSLRTLDYLRRQILFWTYLVIKLALWTLVLGIGFYVYERGFDQALEDFGWIYGIVSGLGEEGQRVGGARARERRGQERVLRAAGDARRRTRGGGW